MRVKFKSFVSGTALILSFCAVLLSQRGRVPLPESATLEGIVVDADTGMPLAEVNILAEWPPQWPPPAPNEPLLFPIVRSDKDGRFIRDNIHGQNGRAWVTFIKEGYDSPNTTFAIHPGEHLTGVTIRMPRKQSGVIGGRVMDTQGSPIAAVAVTIFKFWPSNSWVAQKTFVTDDRGEYRIYGITPGRYIVGLSTPLDTTIPLLGFSVPGDSNPPGRGLTPPGTSPPVRQFPSMLYPAAGNVSKAELITVEDQKETRLRDSVIGSAALGKIRIRIRNTGEPAKDVVLSGNLGFNTRRLHLDAGSEWSNDYSPNGPGNLTFSLTGKNELGQVVRFSASVIFDGDDTELEIDFSRLHGSLSAHVFVEQPDGSLLPFGGESDIVLLYFGPPKTSLAVPVANNGTGIAKDGITGRYRIIQFDIPPDWYVASASQGDRDALTEGVEVSDPSRVLEIRLKSNPGTFQGTVVDKQGLPVSSARIVLLPVSRDPDQVGARRGDWTDHTGHFEIPGLIPGKYLAFAAQDIELDFTNHHTVLFIDPDFINRFRDRAVPIEIGENGRIIQDLTLLPQ